MKGKYKIRIDSQDLCFDWVEDEFGIKRPKKIIIYSELVQDLKSNGLKIFDWDYSGFGQCYFFNVSGNYTGNLKLKKIS